MLSSDPLFYNTIALLLMFLLFSITPSTRYAQVVDVPKFAWSIPVGIFAIWVMAKVPVVLGTWTDRAAYGSTVVFYQQNGFQEIKLASSGEWFFQLYTYVVSLFTTYKGWFYVTATIYVGNYLIAARRLTMEYAYVLFFSILANFQFYSYGMNTIRAGFAASFVLLGLTFCNKIWAMLLCFFMAMYTHNSMIVPIMSLLIAYKFTKPKFFMWSWVAIIIISYFSGNFFQHFLVGFAEERRSGYFSVDASQTIYRVGFRWDFLLYSAIPVLLGYYYIFKLNFKSYFYQWVYCAYLIANSFWVLVIRAEFTDRFAYLSWFLFPVILIYPLLTKQLFYEERVQRNYISMILLCQYAFNYYMYLAYHGFKPW